MPLQIRGMQPHSTVDVVADSLRKYDPPSSEDRADWYSRALAKIWSYRYSINAPVNVPKFLRSVAVSRVLRCFWLPETPNSSSTATGSIATSSFAKIRTGNCHSSHGTNLRSPSGRVSCLAYTSPYCAKRTTKHTVRSVARGSARLGRCESPVSSRGTRSLFSHKCGLHPSTEEPSVTTLFHKARFCFCLPLNHLAGLTPILSSQVR